MSVATEHTPGPWTLSEEAPREGLLSRLVHGPSMMIAIVRTETQGGHIGDANAHLISAAPELLEAAKLALALVEEIQDEEGFSRSTAIPAVALRTAIAKAEQSA